MNDPFPEGEKVEVRTKHGLVFYGYTTGKLHIDSAGKKNVQARINNKINWYPASQLEVVLPENTVEDDILNHKFADLQTLRKILLHLRLGGKLDDMIYSMLSTNTDFHAYQFKPVLKMINSPSGGLLIADEVGLGKTIEAGLIWTEFQVRYNAKNLLVMCPLSLIEKWRIELKNKFDIHATICKADALLEVIDDISRGSSKGGAYICAKDSIRPNKEWEDDTPEQETMIGRNNQTKLARRLQELADGKPLFDLLVVDEAHHLRNPNTLNHQIAQLLRSISEHAAFLSATPIHLRNEDLFAQLKLLDPGSFESKEDFIELLEANRPMVEARDTLLYSDDANKAMEHVREALGNPLLADSRCLSGVLSKLEGMSKSLGVGIRSELASTLESANLLSNIVTWYSTEGSEGVVDHQESASDKETNGTS